MSRSRGVPVVMYHSVMPRNGLWARISDPVEEFEKSLVWLKEAGFKSIFLYDLYDWMKGRTALPEKSVVLTFDDGYLDNWLYAYPLLRKYGHRATIFPSLEFIGEGAPRSAGDFQTPGDSVGYLNWSELTEMQNSGFVDIQSHTMTHSWEFCSAEIVDVLNPSPRYSWMAWNADSTVKPFWKPGKVEPGLTPGYPVFAHDRSLGVRRFIPDEDFVERFLCEFVRRGGVSILASPSGKAELVDYFKGVPPGERGRMETDSEFQKRADYELGASREILSSRLKKPVRFLCWPGGGRHRFLDDRWASYGYLAASLPRRLSGRDTNLRSDSPDSFVRISSGLGEWRFMGRPVARLNSSYFREIVNGFMGIPGAKGRMRMIKLKLLLGNLFSAGTGD